MTLEKDRVIEGMCVEVCLQLFDQDLIVGAANATLTTQSLSSVNGKDALRKQIELWDSV